MALAGLVVGRKELKYCSLQEKLDDELKELDKRLEQKEVNVWFLNALHARSGVGWRRGILDMLLAILD